MAGSQRSWVYIGTSLTERLKEAPNVVARLTILENELLSLLDDRDYTPENFRQFFYMLKGNENSIQIADFCQRNNMGMRQLERMYNKYVGLSAMTFGTLNRFQNSLNQVLHSDYSKLSDIAFDNGYFDQTHFIKDFKRFAGDTPKSFVHQNNSILQIGKLT